ncbi:MAG TPA: MarR family winged helix-turn-helix transcriptional regulator [Herpetosiphonaceae bacterium]
MGIDSEEPALAGAARLAAELRSGYGLGATFFRAAAASSGLADTDIQVLDLLERTGAVTAGQLATLMGLTTGTFTAILNRLEKAGVVCRERDPQDGRRVIVRRTPRSDGAPDPGALFAALETAWSAMAADYDDAQQAMLVAFLDRSNQLAREEIGRLRGEAGHDEGEFSTPLAGWQRAQLAVHAEGVQLSVRAADLAGALYQARFTGPAPDVKVTAAGVTIRYPRRLWGPGKEPLGAEILLNTAIPWGIALQGGGAEMTASLGGLDLLELEVRGAGSAVQIELPAPIRAVPIGLRGGGSAFTVRRPRGVAARVQLSGWGTGIAFDDQSMSELGSAREVQSPNYHGAHQRYDLALAGSGSMLTVTAE